MGGRGGRRWRADSRRQRHPHPMHCAATVENQVGHSPCEALRLLGCSACFALCIGLGGRDRALGQLSRHLRSSQTRAPAGPACRRGRVRALLQFSRGHHWGWLVAARRAFGQPYPRGRYRSWSSRANRIRRITLLSAATRKLLGCARLLRDDACRRGGGHRARLAAAEGVASRLAARPLGQDPYDQVGAGPLPVED